MLKFEKKLRRNRKMNKFLTIAASGFLASVLVANTTTTTRTATAETPKETSTETTTTKDVDVTKNPITGSKKVTKTSSMKTKTDGVSKMAKKTDVKKYDKDGKLVEDSTKVEKTNP